MARPRAGKPLLTGTERPWRTGRSRVSGHHPLSGQKSKLHYCCFDHRFAKPLRNIAHVFWHRHRADLGWSTHGRWSRRSGLSPYPRSRRPVLFVGGNEYCRNMRILLRTSSRFSWADSSQIWGRRRLPGHSLHKGDIAVSGTGSGIESRTGRGYRPGA